MAAEWEAFESEVLRDITDSQFAFQITLERVEVNYNSIFAVTCIEESHQNMFVFDFLYSLFHDVCLFQVYFLHFAYISTFY